MSINSKHSKVSNVEGTNATFKKDGYAAGPVPKSMIGTKTGVVKGGGYNGPNVAQGRHDGA
jgi:hypothetical protein